ncbi:MAG: ATP synthase F1 subunit epsilon, partial [Verrucomicrobiia bacterium]
AKLKVEIVTPEAVAFQGEADMVILPSVDGQVGILPQHVPLITQIVPGELSLTNNNKEELLAIGGGFAEVTGFQVSILTDMAVGESEIDEEAVAAALARAEATMAAISPQDEEQAALEASVARSLAQLNLKRRRRS